MAIGNHDTGTTPAVATPTAATFAVPGSAGTASGEGLLAVRDGLWVEFQQARRELAEVMSDEELAGLGFNLAVLDEAP